MITAYLVRRGADGTPHEGGRHGRGALCPRGRGAQWC